MLYCVVRSTGDILYVGPDKMEMSKQTILVVEDAPDISSLFKIYFTSQGYEVMTAMCGAVALEICSKTPPNLVLLDVNLLDMEGYDIGKTLRQSARTRHIPIIFLTARGEKRDRLKGLGEVQAEYYIVKPFDIEEVHTIVKGALDRARQKNLAHPVTNLPTAELINEQYRALLSGSGWALAQLHINGFETFTQAYGAVVGEDVLKFSALLLSEVVNELGNSEDFIGQMVVGPDFIVTSAPEQLRAICEKLAERFDAEIGLHYNYKDRHNSYIVVNDENGVPQQAPLMSLAIGVITSDNGPFLDLREITLAVSQTYQKARALAREQGRRSFVHHGYGWSPSRTDSEAVATEPQGQTWLLLDRRAAIEHVARQPDAALLALSVVSDARDVREIFQSKEIIIPNAQWVLPIGTSDVAAIIPAAQLEASIDEVLELFYGHPLVQQDGDALLTFGCAQGPSGSANDLIEAAALDLIERRASQGITSMDQPAILKLAPERMKLLQRYQTVRQRRDSYERQLAAKPSIEELLRAEISSLTAVIDHDLKSGLVSLHKTLAELQQAGLSEPAGPAVSWMRQRLSLCTAWQYSMVELGAGQLLQPQALDMMAWLKEHIPLLSGQLAEQPQGTVSGVVERSPATLAIEMDDLPAVLPIALDGQALLATCLHLLRAAHAAKATLLRISAGPVHDDGGFTLIFEDDGQYKERLQTLRATIPLSHSSKLRWPYAGLLLLRHMLQQQRVGVECKQSKKHLQMIWNMPGKQIVWNMVEGHMIGGVVEQSLSPRYLKLRDLERETALLEAEVARLQTQITASNAASEEVVAEQARELLLPYVQELERNLLALANKAEALMTLAGIKVDSAQRILRLSLYCYILARNLVLALKGGELPLERVDMNEQIHQVCDLLEHKIAHVHVVLDLAPDLPPIAIASIEAKQVLMNLIRNAVEATELGKDLFITTRAEQGSVVIQIRDTGVGIARANREKIFELHFSTKGQGTNSGVGLFAVESIVGRAGGQIRVASAALDEQHKLVSWKSNFRHNPCVWKESGTLFQVEFPVIEGE
jgi:DNA-binding response OmpR family regulator/signal transduction histidine kinase